MSNPAQRPRISIITVNYETSDMVRRLAESLERQELPHEFIVVDNPSPARDVENLRSITNVHLIENPQNVGYGLGLNAGAKIARGDFIGILNPDCAVPDGELRKWVAVLEQENAAGANIGVLGPRLMNDNGTVQRSSYDFVNPLNYWIYHSLFAGIIKTLRKRVLLRAREQAGVRRAGWVMGAAMLLPRDVFETVGGFSKSYFMYAEDADLCWRVTASGRRVCYAPEVGFIHTQGEPSPERRDRGMIMLFTSIRTFLFEHFGPVRRAAVSGCVLLDMLIRIAVFGVLRVVRPGDQLTRSRLRGAVTILKLYAGFSPDG